MINPQVLSVSRLPPAARRPMLSSPLLPALRGLASIVYGQSGERKMECTWGRKRARRTGHRVERLQPKAGCRMWSRGGPLEDTAALLWRSTVRGRGETQNDFWLQDCVGLRLYSETGHSGHSFINISSARSRVSWAVIMSLHRGTELDTLLRTLAQMLSFIPPANL